MARTSLSGACSRLSEISRNPLLCVYRDVPARNDTLPESDIDLFGEPQTPCDQETDEHDVIPNTRKRRRLLRKSPASARFSLDDFDENDVIPAQAECSVPPFAENLDEKRPVVGTICSFGFEGDPLSAQKHIVNLAGLSLRDTSTPSSSSRREVTAPSCPVRSRPMIRRQNRVNKGKRAKTKLLLHDKSVFDDPCRRSTPGFFLR